MYQKALLWTKGLTTINRPDLAISNFTEVSSVLKGLMTTQNLKMESF